MPSRSAPDVSIVLPVFNEVGHIATEIERIKASMDASGYRYEIVVVDDGSTDGSAEVLDGIKGIRRLTFAENRGCGAARQAGTALAGGAVVAWTDADMSYPNERIPEFVARLGGHDQIVGSRQSEHGTLRLIRTPVKGLIRLLASHAMGTRIPDLNSGFRVFRRDVALQYLHLMPAGFSCVTTITMTFLADGYSILFVPIEYSRRAGVGKFHWRSDTRRYVQQVVRLSLRYRPFRILGPVGATVGLVGVVAIGASRGASTTGSVLLVGGAVIAGGGLVARTVSLGRVSTGDVSGVSDR